MGNRCLILPGLETLYYTWHVLIKLWIHIFHYQIQLLAKSDLTVGKELSYLEKNEVHFNAKWFRKMKLTQVTVTNDANSTRWWHSCNGTIKSNLSYCQRFRSRKFSALVAFKIRITLSEFYDTTPGNWFLED